MTKQQSSIFIILFRMNFPINAYYPIEISAHKAALTYRLILCILMVSQMLFYLFLRILTILRAQPNKQSQVEQKKKAGNIIVVEQIQSGIDLKQRIDEDIKNKRKSCQNSNNTQSLNDPNRQTEKHTSAISKYVQQQTVIRQQNDINQSDQPESGQSSSSSSSSSSPSSSSSTSRENESQQIQYRNQVKSIEYMKSCQYSMPYIKIKHLHIASYQSSQAMNVLSGHFFIALCAAAMYYPFWCTVVLGVTHFAVLFAMGLTCICLPCQKKLRNLIIKIGIVVEFAINLGLLLLTIFGIAKSNPEFFKQNLI